VLSDAPATEVAERFALDPERVRLMPAGMLVLEAASQALGCPLTIGRGGLREGVLLELAGGMIGDAP
jgi:exopolyphosphatase/guanosine-5'-triphosphate,3'-diphosphate pyrophosphatase